ncbi:MAG TPA: hypothetical protein VF817_01770 [Patescibacteria group bacterium]
MAKIRFVGLQSSVMTSKDHNGSPKNLEELGKMFLKASKFNQGNKGNSLTCTITVDGGASLRIIEEEEGLSFYFPAQT